MIQATAASQMEMGNRDTFAALAQTRPLLSKTNPMLNMMKPTFRLLCLLALPASVFAQGNSAVLLTTINNPTPAAFDLFGGAVATMGEDRMLISAEAAAGGAGEVYLFSLNGTLLTTFTNPGTAGNGFGGLGGASGLAAMGNDRVLIGAYNSVGGVPLDQIGAAFLASSN